MKDRIKQYALAHKKEIALVGVTVAITALVVTKRTNAKYVDYIHIGDANDQIKLAYHPTMGDWLLEQNRGKIMQLVPMS